ncbi:Kinetochore-associated protein MTW1 [Paramyrothecium foliicola]|nr:Kinetochore-associated protein MTW1 [Paramyrothecium foliicola]
MYSRLVASHRRPHLSTTTMTAPGSTEYEFLTEHFSYPPVSLIDDIINTVNVLADRALGSVEQLLLTLPPQSLGFTNGGSKPSKNGGAPPAGEQLSPEEAAKREIENGTHQLETLLNASIDKNFDLFELYTMRNIITVRPQDQPFVRLAHYDGLDFPAVAAAGPDRPTPESVNALRRRLRASQKLHVALETERARNDALLRQLRASMGLPEGGGADVKKEEAAEPKPSAFGFLRDKRSLEEEVGTNQPIATTTEFALSQLQSLRALSTSLRTILPDLGGGSGGDGDDAQQDPSAGGKSWRRERSEYVEAASRKYLETARGLELGDQGDVRDGEWQGEGRRLTKGEVENLEKVAAMLRPGGDGAGAGDGDAMDES